MKKCPYCAEEIQDEAVKCKHCGEFLRMEEKESIVEKNKYKNIINSLIGKGRIGRLFFFTFMFILGIIVGIIEQISINVTFIIFIKFILMYFATILNTKRLHDINKSGYYILPVLIGSIIVIMYITFLVKSVYGYININEDSILITILMFFGFGISVLWVLYSFLLGVFLTFKKGTDGENKYGI